MSGLENLCDLLFELSNEDRLRILRQLEKEAMSVTSLSRTLGLTTQESSRHQSRLAEVGLTIKDANGVIYLSTYGRLVLRQLRGIEFTSRYRDYFTSHSLECLPQEFVSRIGELADSTYIDNFLVTIYRAEKTLKEAEENILLINFPYYAGSFPLILEAYDRGIKAKFIRTRDHQVPDIMMEEPQRAIVLAAARARARARRAGNYESKLIEKCDLILYMSEKEVAILSFPMPNGKFDLLGFSSEDKRTYKWCFEIFQYYWERAKPDF